MRLSSPARCGETDGHGDVEVGEELSATSGAYSPQTLFIQNGWTDFNRIEHLLTFDAYVGSDDPPYSAWLQKPSTSPIGGIFAVTCCDTPPSPSPIGPIPSPVRASKSKALSAIGIPAIKASDLAGTPGSREGIIRDFALQSRVLKVGQTTDMKTVSKVSCDMSSNDIAATLKMQEVNLILSQRFCYAEMSGKFHAYAPPSASKDGVVTYSKAFEVFDQMSGNMVMSGAIP
jgi:hypothetical protein